MSPMWLQIHYANLIPYLHDVSLACEYLNHRSIRGRSNFLIHFFGFDLVQRLPSLEWLSRLLVPLDDRGFLHVHSDSGELESHLHGKRQVSTNLVATRTISSSFGKTRLSALGAYGIETSGTVTRLI